MCLDRVRARGRGGFGGVNYPQLKVCAVTLRDFCVAQNHLKVCICSPRDSTKLGFDDLGIILVRFSCRLVVRDRFFCPLGLVLGSFWGAPGVVLVLFRHFNSSIQPINSSIHRFNPSTHQLIDSSTHGPSALSYPARRTARCAIK